MFDESRLDDPAALGEYGPLYRLATTGARLREESAEEVAGAVAALSDVRPRCVVVIGAEAELIATVAAASPVPLVAWTAPGLPTWAGPLDLVVVLAGADEAELAQCVEAGRRGAMLLVVAAQTSPVIDRFGPAPVVVTRDDDDLVAALLGLTVLERLGLAPGAAVGAVADACDAAAELSGPRHELGRNPAKELACALADRVPLVYGGSALAGLAAGRIAQALRQATGRPAVAAGAAGLAPLIEAVRPGNLFDDPVEGGQAGWDVCLVCLDEGSPDPGADHLTGLAVPRRVRVETIRETARSPVQRYVGLLQSGRYAAAYLGLCLTPNATERSRW